MSAVEGVHIVAVWRDGDDGEIVADSGDISSSYHAGWADGEPDWPQDSTHARGLYRVTWRGEDDPPEVERVGDLPDVDALAVMP